MILNFVYISIYPIRTKVPRKTVNDYDKGSKDAWTGFTKILKGFRQNVLE